METIEECIKSINKIIKFKKEDTLLNHIKTFFEIYDLEYCGIVTNNEFKIWKHSRSVGAFYHVIIGIVIMRNNKPIIILKTKMNIFGMFIRFIMFGLFLFGILSGTSKLLDSSWTNIWKDLLFFILLLIVFVIFITLIFGYHRRSLIDEFKSKLKTFENNR